MMTRKRSHTHCRAMKFMVRWWAVAYFETVTSKMILTQVLDSCCPLNMLYSFDRIHINLVVSKPNFCRWRCGQNVDCSPIIDHIKDFSPKFPWFIIILPIELATWAQVQKGTSGRSQRVRRNRSSWGMGLSENSVPLHPMAMVNDHYPY